MPLAAVHLAHPRQAHRHDRGEISEALLHAVLAFRIAIEENRHNAVAYVTSELGDFRGLVARHGIGTETHRGDAELVELDNVVGPFDQEQAQAANFFRDPSARNWC